MDTEENMAGISDLEFRTLFTQHYTCNLDKLSYGVTGSSPGISTNSLATLYELSTVLLINNPWILVDQQSDCKLLHTGDIHWRQNTVSLSACKLLSVTVNLVEWDEERSRESNSKHLWNPSCCHQRGICLPCHQGGLQWLFQRAIPWYKGYKIANWHSNLLLVKDKKEVGKPVESQPWP